MNQNLNGATPPNTGKITAVRGSVIDIRFPQRLLTQCRGCGMLSEKP
ncbi:hypothetical protein [Thiothrix nivea]|nr:hypothetical protein [Thiothrix nivea]